MFILLCKVVNSPWAFATVYRRPSISTTSVNYLIVPWFCSMPGHQTVVAGKAILPSCSVPVSTCSCPCSLHTKPGFISFRRLDLFHLRSRISVSDVFLSFCARTFNKSVHSQVLCQTFSARKVLHAARLFENNCQFSS